MKKLLYVCLAVAFIFTACSKSSSNDPSQFAGSWSGTFSGGDNGTWAATISSSGAVNGNTSSVNGNGTVTGSVTDNGSFSATVGSGSLGTIFSGQMSGNSGNGTWSNSSEDLSGTWSGNKQ
jgi:hypothetical protein